MNDNDIPSALEPAPEHKSFKNRLGKFFVRARQDDSDNQFLRKAIEELMDDHDENNTRNHGVVTTSSHERLLITNILKLQKKIVDDVMIPRADIIGIEISSTQKEILSLFSEHQFSRMPVYREQMDDIVGMIHIKDILGQLSVGKKINIEEIIRDIPIISPSMSVIELILFMKEKRKHMVMVVDEYGGIDGLATLNDIIGSIVGEIEDEYDTGSEILLAHATDGSILAEGRVDLEEFENKFGAVFTEEEREEADTLGGLVSMIAGRVPAAGEIIYHDSGLHFEVLDADPRRINRLKITHLDKALEKLSA